MLFPFQLIKLYDINHLNNSVVNKLRTNTETVNNPLANGQGSPANLPAELK